MAFCNECGIENPDNSRYCSKCGSLIGKIVHSKDVEHGLLDNRYEIKSIIKSGGMGSVFKAYDNRLRRICAVKEMLSHFSSKDDLKYAVRRFEDEAFILANLKHDNLPAIYDYFIATGRYYLVMDLIEGEDLEAMLQRDGKPGLPEDCVVEWAKQILSVLDYLHNQNPPIVYRDIKPSNIILRSDGRVILIDFGIARTIQGNDNGLKTSIGTDGYAPVEQYQGMVSPQSDLYALGATMHHLLTGRRPIPFKFNPIRTIIPALSPQIEEIIIKALNDSLEERYATAREMLDSLNFMNQSVLSLPSESVSVPVVISMKPSMKYSFTMKWGTLGAGDNQFQSPRGIGIDAMGNLYIADMGNCRIQKFDCHGKFIKSWRPQGYKVVDIELYPGVAVDHEGFVYISDTANETIMKFDSEGNFILQWGAFGSDPGYFCRPSGIAVDMYDNVYVADTKNHRVQKFDTSGNFITAWGDYGYEDGQFYDPKDIVVDPSGNVYVTHGKKDRIQEFDCEGRFVKKWGTKGSGDGQFEDVKSITMDAMGYIYIADTRNNRIQKFDGEGNFITKFGSYGSGDGKFKDPCGIAVDTAGNLYVTDAGNNRIQKFSPV